MTRSVTTHGSEICQFGKYFLGDLAQKNIPTIDSGYLWNICIQSNLNPNNRSNKKLVMFTAVAVMVVCMVTSATGPF